MMRLGLVIAALLLASCDSHEPVHPVTEYIETASHTYEGGTVVIIEYVHSLVPDGSLTIWVQVGTRITRTFSSEVREHIATHERPLRHISGAEFEALDTGACYLIETGEMLIIRSCRMDLIIVEADRL